MRSCTSGEEASSVGEGTGAGQAVSEDRPKGALTGIKVVEVAAVGPAPFGAMVMADMGASVIRVDRPDRIQEHPYLARGRRSIAVNLKDPRGTKVLLDLLDDADVLIEGYRPGVAEKLGFGPDTCLQRYPKLVYARMTGWGQTGPYSPLAGHDINYIALAGVLGALGGENCPPFPPLNLVGDFGGGGMLLAFGVLCALVERSRSGQGQVVDAAMVDGTGLLMTSIYEMLARGEWIPRRGVNMLDGGAYFYGVYETSDGGYIAVGAIEPKFHARFLEALGLPAQECPSQWDRSGWSDMRARIAEVIGRHSRKEWEHRLERVDACVVPVLSLDEVPNHPHVRARNGFVDQGGQMVPSPAPRMSRTPPCVTRRAPCPGEHTDEILAELGYGSSEIEQLRAWGTVA